MFWEGLGVGHILAIASLQNLFLFRNWNTDRIFDNTNKVLLIFRCAKDVMVNFIFRIIDILVLTSEIL